MSLNSLLFKIETGQTLNEKQVKKLAKKLWLAPSSLRTLVFAFLAIAVLVFLFLGITDSLKPLPPLFSYTLSVAIIVSLVYASIFPRQKRIFRYFDAVDTFYETKFKGLDHFDLYYIGQHKSPHVRALRSTKIYLLSNHQQLIFIDDYFKNSEYKLPSAFKGDQDVFLRIIDETKNDASRLTIEISEIDYFRLQTKNTPIKKRPRLKKIHNIFDYFLDQNPYMDDYNFITLKLYNGAVFRISYDAYYALKNAIPLKEK
jgi:hypothetical protein